MAPEPEPAPPPEPVAPVAVEAPAAVEPRDPTLSPREAAELLAASIVIPPTPIEPPPPPKPARPRFTARVQAIIAMDGRNSAIVDGKTVAAGDRVGGAKVISISQDRVTFDYRGKRIVKQTGD
jgi:hypothetical protein